MTEVKGNSVLFKTNSGETLTLTGAAANATARAIVLRPQNIEIAQKAGPDTLPGTVLHREFLGSTIRYVVSAAGTEIVVDESHVSGRADSNRRKTCTCGSTPRRRSF